MYIIPTMGNLEREVARQVRNGKVQKAILQSLAVAGILSLAVLAPNAMQILKVFGNKKRSSSKYNIINAAHRLAKSGLIRFEETKYGKVVRLTKEGEAKLRLFELADFKIKKPKRWDKKWRMLIFDIKEERKNTRDKVRRTLQQIGFTRLQDSVWVYPYDCEDLIVLLKSDFKIGKDVLYVIADKIENDRFLRKFYRLE